MKKFLLVVLALMMTLTGVSAPAETARTREIAILFTGDVHCAVDDNIGYAGLSAYRAELESAGCAVALVDTGDAIQGAAIGSFTRGETIIEIMNAAGYSVMAVGNHEFDYEGVARLVELSGLADFPIVSANLTRVGEGPLFAPYAIIELDGVKIAFVGVTTPMTITSSTPKYFMNDAGEFVYDFLADGTGEALWASVQGAADAAREEGAQYVIALAHLGINAEDAPYLSGELITHTTGIDAVLDGHSHTVMPVETVLNRDGQNVALASTGTGLENIGVLRISPDGVITTELVSDYAEKDAAVTALIEEKRAEYAETLEAEVVVTENALVIEDPATGARIVRNAETNLGDLTADAYRAISGADIAFMNGGGLRVTIPEGATTYGEILSVLPFGNILCVVRVPGQVVLDALEFGAHAAPEEFGGFLQVSGLTYEVDLSIPSSVKMDDNGLFISIDGEYRVKNVMVAGQPLDVNAYYTLVSHNYMLKNLGDGFTMFEGCELVRDEFIIDCDALTEYMKTTYPLDTEKYADPYGEGRITLTE